MLLVDLKSETIAPLHMGSGLYFGIAKGPDGSVYVAARNRMVSSAAAIENERGSILIFSSDFVLQQEVSAPFPLRDMHGVLWHDSALWITCSRDNFIAIFDGSNWRKWYPTQEDIGATSDIHHYNTLGIIHNDLCLLAHNNGDSELFIFDQQSLTLQTRLPLGRIAHNIWCEGGVYFTCSSGEGDIVGSDGFRFHVGGFPRGYTQLPDGRRAVGINEYTERAARDKTTSCIRIYDTTWNPDDEIAMPIGSGMLLDVVSI